MNLNSFLKQLWKFLVVTLGLTLLSMVARGVLPRPQIIASMPVPADPGRAFGAFLFINALYALLMQFIALRSKVGGWRLYLALVSLQAGIGTVMLQIETLFFGQAFPELSSSDTLLLILNGLVVGALFPAFLMAVQGRWKKGPETITSLVVAVREHWDAIVASMVLYPVIYFLFGYFVAYGSATTVAFYRDATITDNTVLLVAFQILRGGLWALCAIPISSVLPRREHAMVALAGGLPLFSGLALIFENPVMPEAVRYAHGFELTTSMALFGILLCLMLAPKR